MVKYISDRIGVLHLGHLVEMGSTDDIFNNPVHPYTKSLLSAIPEPNPLLERNSVSLSYDYGSSGIDYTLGKSQEVSGGHFVLATDVELKNWMK